MGSYTFKWAHPGDEVYVTGTFDNWSKSEKMEKKGDVFEKTVTLPDSSEKIYYKFVVDGNWSVSDSDKQENDPSGNLNNLLTPEEIVKSAPPATAIMSSVSPDSTTAQLAKDVPLEKKTTDEENHSVMAGTFPETPALEEMLNNPIGINPLPAADGAVNPIKLAPGEPIPKDLTAANTNSHVKLDQASYEKSDALPGADGLDTLPPVTNNMIPESSLPMGEVSPFINSAGPGATTAALAAQVPLEPKVPEVVKESQEKAGAEPEASGNADEVKEKDQVEEELLKKVPEAPSTSEGTAGQGTDKSEGDKTLLETAAITTASIGAAVGATALATKDTVVAQATPEVNQASASVSAAATDAAAKLPDSVKEQLPVSVQEAIATNTKEATIEEVSPEVPAEVKESIVEAGKSPEAAANTAAVEEKKVMETELLKEVKPVKSIDEASKVEETPKIEEAAPKAEEVTPKAVAKELPMTEDVLTTNDVPKTEEVTPKADANGANGTTAAEVAPATPAKDKDTVSPLETTTPGSSKSASEQKKKNRVSGFFGKLRQKISHSPKDK